MSRVDVYRYQVVMLGDRFFIRTLSEDLRGLLDKLLAELHMESSLLHLALAEEAEGLDYSLPVIGLFFGDSLWRKSEVTDSRVLQGLKERGIPVLPVINSPDTFKENVPVSLYPVNALCLSGENGEARLVLVANYIFREFHLLRHHRKVFISYCRNDAMNHAVQLHGTLSAHGFEVFLDTHSIEKGVDFQKDLRHQLMDADIMIALHTDNYMSRKWVQEELTEAGVLQIGVVEVQWPGRGNLAVQPGRWQSLSYSMTIKEEDMVCPVWYEKVKERIVMAVEHYLARSFQARVSNLLGPFIHWLRKEGKSYTVHSSRIIFGGEEEERILFVPAVGIPDAKVMDEARLWIQEYLRNECGESGVRVCLVYDKLYMKKKWLDHLRWLDRYLPVKSVHIRELDSYDNVLDKWNVRN